MPIVPDNSKPEGFTLIELLLVIAIISILAALGIMSYRRYFQVNRIDKVAVSMQHVLEAAMAFYVDQSKWPDPRGCGASGSDQDDFITDYLPNANYKSYYGTDFCWKEPQDTKHLFWVAVEVPGDSDGKIHIAKRLAARLPNAITTSEPDDPISQSPPPCTDSKCYVRAEITVPGVSTNSIAGMTLAASGDCRTAETVAGVTGNCEDTSTSGQQDYRISFTACPEGTTPTLRINPNFITVPSAHTGYVLAEINAVESSCTQSPDSSGNESCLARAIVASCNSNGRHDCVDTDIKSFGGKAGASYMVTCNTHDNRGGS